MSCDLNKLTIKGFKSIRELENFELNKLNVLIGGNGAGKSNFVEIFRVLRAMVGQNLGNYVQICGGADGFLFNGPKYTSSIQAHFIFGLNEYKFTLKPSVSEKFVIETEAIKYEKGNWSNISRGGEYESQLKEAKEKPGKTAIHGVGFHVFNALANWTVYHFHDTSNRAAMRRSEMIEDHERFREDASNIAPFLLALRRNWKAYYEEIIRAIQLVTPFFDEFLLKTFKEGQSEKVKLDWKQKGSDYPMQPYHLSDGTIRFICLATALLQPDPPSTIVIDEPELGLHPYAIEIIAELIKATSKKTQVIISTQSPPLVDYFSPEDIIVVDRERGESTFQRLNTSKLTLWLEEYSLGDLWRKNVLNGGPSSE